MIQATFNLNSIPFSKNIGEKHLFLNSQYEEMLNRLLFLFENMGIGMFTGEVGSGKSTMVRAAISRLSQQIYKPVYLYRGFDNLGTFYRKFAQQLGIQPKYRQSEVADQVISTIAEIYKEQKIKTILVIDEAHLLKTEILDEIRLIHNAEMDSKDYLATAIVGQPPLKKMMEYRKFLPLSQRISISYHLPALDREDAYKYFKHQLKTVKAADNMFMDNAVETIINASKGIPRVINNIALKAMYAAVQKKMTTVDQECVLVALEELGLK